MNALMILMQLSVALGACAWTIAGCFNPDAIPLMRLIISFPIVALALYGFVTTCNQMAKKDPSVYPNRSPWR